MEERLDGSFGPIEEISEFWDRVNRKQDVSNVKAFHFGTKRELEKVREKKSTDQRLEALENEVESWKKPESDLIHTPDSQEIDFFNSDTTSIKTSDIFISGKELHNRETAIQSKQAIRRLSRKHR